MRSMREFDPGRPARMHDRRRDKTIVWRTAWASKWRAHAVFEPNGWVYFDGAIIDGWEPLNAVSRGRASGQERKSAD